MGTPMRRAGALLLLLHTLYGNDIFLPYTLEYTSTLHSEYEKSLGKDSNDSFPSESNSYASWYNVLNFNYDINDDFYVSLGGKANLVLGEDNYKAPFYLRAKLTSDQLNQAMISEASLNYDDNFLSVSIGRSDIDYDWLLGSMDGIIGSIGSDDDLSLRLFWFQNFTQLQYNYYFKLNDINEGDGMYGAIVKAKRGNFELTLFDYYMQDLRNILGLHVNYTSQSYAVNFSHSSGNALGLALYEYDESLTQLSVETLYKNHFFEVGGSITGDNGLLAMIQLGSFMTGQFYLSNQVDRENARNAYVRYIHAKGKWQVELLGGYTTYDNTFLSLADDLSSYEIDAYYAYRFDPAWSLNLGAMVMNVNERDPISVDQYLLTLNIGYHYELF
jgi:hypothetical protein